MNNETKVIILFTIKCLPIYSRYSFPFIMQQIDNINSHLIHKMIVKCIECY
jgi:hypothetical protein